MDSRIMIFNKPLWFAYQETDIRQIVEIWGCILPSHLSPNKVNDEYLEEYLNYLCGVSKWEQEGNSVKGSIWTSNISGETYHYFDPFVQDYIKRSRQQKYLTYLVLETNQTLDKETDGILDGEFLVSRSLYNTIVENGVVVDVKKSPNE